MASTVDSEAALLAARVSKYLTELLETEPNWAAMKQARARFDRDHKLADPEGRPRSDLNDL